jgi:hypothetical protein
MLRNKKRFLKIASALTLSFWANIAFPQPVIEVLASNNAQKVESQAELCLAQLNVKERLHLTIEFTSKMPAKMEGITHSLRSAPNGYPAFKVYIDERISIQQQWHVLAHEMIHVKQYIKNELVIIDQNRVLWKGKNHYYYPKYNQQMPWEQEAYQFDHTLVKLVESTEKRCEELMAEQLSSNTKSSIREMFDFRK